MEEVDCRFIVLPARAVMSVKVPMLSGGMEVLRCKQIVSEVLRSSVCRDLTSKLQRECGG